MRKNALLAASAITATLALSVTGIQSSGAAPGESISGDHVKSTRPFAKNSAQAQQAVAAARAGVNELHASASDRFTVKAALQDSTGATNVRVSRKYRGLQVLGGDAVVHRNKAGAVTKVSQTLGKQLSLKVEPTLTADQAAAKVSGTQSGTPQLVVDARGASPRLAYLVTTVGTQADGTPSEIQHSVDALTGAILGAEQQVHTVGGEGKSLYEGTVPLQLTQSGTSYQLKDPTRGNTYTTDFANGTDSRTCEYYGINCKTGTLFTSTDTSFGNGSTSSRESAAVDAQYGSNETWDYFKNVHGRSGIFDTGAGSFNRVHYGKSYNNAFWHNGRMTYGDGDGVNYGPLVSLDVAGHEMSHGVTEYSADLVYSGESGGLNEATSDIFGTMVEFYANNPNDPADYYIGEEFDLKAGKGFRRMDNPASDGRSVNCWSTSVGGLDPHLSSGIGNHFFYLLAEGSGAKTIGGKAHSSTTCNGSTVTGIGRDAASDIWYRALTVYMTSNTNYKGARTATLNAARDLYGSTSTQYTAVAAAWSAVSVS